MTFPKHLNHTNTAVGCILVVADASDVLSPEAVWTLLRGLCPHLDQTVAGNRLLDIAEQLRRGNRFDTEPRDQVDAEGLCVPTGVSVQEFADTYRDAAWDDARLAAEFLVSEDRATYAKQVSARVKDRLEGQPRVKSYEECADEAMRLFTDCDEPMDPPARPRLVSVSN